MAFTCKPEPGLMDGISISTVCNWSLCVRQKISDDKSMISLQEELFSIVISMHIDTWGETVNLRLIVLELFGFMAC